MIFSDKSQKYNFENLNSLNFRFVTFAQAVRKYLTSPIPKSYWTFYLIGFQDFSIKY